MGQDVTLECNSEAFPLSINYWTKKNGEMLISGKKKYSREKLISGKTQNVLDQMKLFFTPVNLLFLTNS